MTARRAIVLGGFIAGTLDILYAITRLFGRSPEWVLQSVASGLQGSAAFDGGAASAALGLASHFSIAIAAAAVYYAASVRVDFLTSHAVIAGAIFGMLVYLFMNFVVIPLSAFPFKLSYPLRTVLEGFASHAVFVGIPIALSIRAAARTANGGKENAAAATQL
ncbi:MAG: hypothetical protein ABI789_08800 [Usitatibacter sp.]